MPQPIQEGLFALCKKRMAEDAEYLRDHPLPADVDMAAFTHYRMYLLRRTVKYSYQNSRFYKRALDDAGVSPEQIQNIDDLQKLPFTTPGDLSGNSYDFLCTSQSHVEHPVTYYSSGTTGIKKRMYFSTRDVRRIRDFMSTGMHTVADPGDTAQIILPNTVGRGIGSILGASLEQIDMRSVVMDMLDTSEAQIAATQKHRPTVWFGDALTIYRITKEMEGRVDLRTLGVKVLFLTMSKVSKQMRQTLSEAWGCRVCTHYGLTEVGWGLAVECPEGVGFHYNAMDTIIEVVDPETGALASNGQLGEVVFTCIDREAMPLIRYRSKDLSALYRRPCVCGCGLPTLDFLSHRQEAATRLPNGTAIWPELLNDAVYGFKRVVDYNIHLDRAGNKLLFSVEALDPPGTLDTQISAALRELPVVRQAGIDICVELLPAGALKQHVLEKKRIREVNDGGNS